MLTGTSLRTVERVDDDLFETTVGSGFPVLARVTYFTPFVPGRISGPPELCYPDEGGEVEYELLTTDRRPAPEFVLKMVSREDDERISQELYELVEENF